MWNEVFLNEELDGVCDGLQQAVRANAHWAEAGLHVCHQLTLDKNHIACDQRNDRDDDYGADEFDPPGLQEM